MAYQDKAEDLLVDKHDLNDLDVTESIRVSDIEAVRSEVISIYKLTYPNEDILQLENAFNLFSKLYRGRLPGYQRCDTIYHDTQHSLDITLAATRLLRGYQTVSGDLPPRKALLGIITALFHDAGYIRLSNDSSSDNGAEYTNVHVSRGAAFMLKHLPALGLSDIAVRGKEIIHLTGYEKPADHILTKDPMDRLAGDIVATADLLAQMADRCYLEKCRDRLFPEMVLATKLDSMGKASIPMYDSADELLRQTPSFYRLYARKRLEYNFQGAFRYAGAYFNGQNYYIQKIENNIRYLENLIADNKLNQLRRHPPKNYGETVFPFEQVRSMTIQGRFKQTN